MAKELRQAEFSKEIDDVMVVLVKVGAALKSGQSAGEIASGILGPFIEGAAGADKIPAELAEDRKVAFQTIGYRLGELADALV